MPAEGEALAASPGVSPSSPSARGSLALAAAASQYQPVDCECAHAPHGVPYRLAM
jgi:hypothetical protein